MKKIMATVRGVVFPGILLMFFTACATNRDSGNFWSFSHASVDPKDSELQPECARKLRKAAPPVQMIDALRRASAFNRDTVPLDRLRRLSQTSSLPDPGTGMEIISRTLSAEDREIPLRIYIPAAARTTPLPVVIYLHGGGWCLGSAADTDDISVGLSRSIPAVVVSVDYRLAPENVYPAGLDDVGEAIAWVVKNAAEYHGDPKNIYLAGNEAGGNLAAGAALKNTVDKGPEIRGVMLFCPTLNLFKTATFSWKRFESGYALDAILVNQQIDCYIPDSRQRNQRYASPALADMRYMPPALVFTAQFDILRDDARRFAEKMRTESRKIRYVCVPGVTHGYLQNRALPQEYNRTMADAAEFVRLTRKADRAAE